MMQVQALILERNKIEEKSRYVFNFFVPKRAEFNSCRQAFLSPE